MTLQEYFADWAPVIDTAEADRIMRKLLGTKAVLCPNSKKVFKAFQLCSLSSLKVIILGQDPYPQVTSKGTIATGLAFANSADTEENQYSPSLEILRESVIDFTIPHNCINFDPSLEKWAKQGVLLLNSALTCEANKPGSHTLIWRPFIVSLLSRLSETYSGLVYILMGTTAQSFMQYINTSSNYVFCVKHPAWYVRQKRRMPSDIWREVNKILIGLYGRGIDWYNYQE